MWPKNQSQDFVSFLCSGWIMFIKLAYLNGNIQQKKIHVWMPTCFREQMRACINNSLHIPCLCLGSQQPLGHWCSTETWRPGCEHVKSHCLGISGRHSSRGVLLSPVSMLWTQVQVEKSHVTSLACSHHGARSFGKLESRKVRSLLQVTQEREIGVWWTLRLFQWS